MQQIGIDFDLKGGTSLSKGFGLIQRFSEDIDVRVYNEFGLNTAGNEDKKRVRNARKKFYDRLAESLKIPGFSWVQRDHDFDDQMKFRSGGIRLHYESCTPFLDGLKNGVLLEAGFDTTTPNIPCNITSWVWDFIAQEGLTEQYERNVPDGVKCYLPGYTLIEKLQTIVRKFRGLTEREIFAPNFMRQYYDVYCLLGDESVLDFIGSESYHAHKAIRFRGGDGQTPLHQHPALFLEDRHLRRRLENQYIKSANLYFGGQPSFGDVLSRIQSEAIRF